MGALRREHDGCVLDDHGYDVEQPDGHADPVRAYCAVTEISFGTRLPRVGVSGGLTSLDYRAHGVTIPRDADAQVVKGKAVSRTALATELVGFLLVAG